MIGNRMKARFRRSELLCAAFLLATSLRAADEKALRVEAEPVRSTVEKRVLFAAPLANETGEDKYDPAAAGLAQLVAAMLSQKDSLVVVDRESLHLLKAEQQRSLAGLTGDAYARQAGKLMKANAVLTGRLFLKDGALVISVKAIDLATERALAADQVSCKSDNLPGAALDMAQKLARQMSLPEPAVDLQRLDASPMASLHFAEGLSRFYSGSLDEAGMHFLRTLDLDPDYVEAHFYCGLCFEQLSEPDHALVEWRSLLKQRPDFKDAAKVRAAIERVSKQAGGAR